MLDLPQAIVADGSMTQPRLSTYCTSPLFTRVGCRAVRTSANTAAKESVAWTSVVGFGRASSRENEADVAANNAQVYALWTVKTGSASDGLSNGTSHHYIEHPVVPVQTYDDPARTPDHTRFE
nr:hypothetical protein CFP56_07425 [Quercus suber]